MNIQFTNISAIIKKIKSLGMHIRGESENEFVTSVYMHAYPGNVISLWIIFASVKERKELS